MIEPMVKITPYVVHNVIASNLGSEGYLLLCLLRKYLELDMLYSFTVQTDENIATIRAKLLEFSQCLKVSYSHACKIMPLLIFAVGIPA